MSLQIGQTVPDFEADTTEGRIKFHDWIGDSWAVLVSHPKDFTPVCTTELRTMAGLKAEFDKRNTKVIAIALIRSARTRSGRRTSGTRRAGAELSDDRRSDARNLEDVRHAAGRRGHYEGRTRRTIDGAQRLRDRPDKKVKLLIAYPMTTGGTLTKCCACSIAAAHGEAGGDARQLEAGR